MAKWLDNILERERRAHLAFFGHIFDLALFQAVLERCDPDTVGEWLGLGLEPHFLPNIETANSRDYVKFPGWKITPGKWFLKIATSGSFCYPISQGGFFPSPDASNLGGRIVLVDIRAKPMLANPNQIFEKDNLLGPIIWKLRRNGSLVSHPGCRVFSRFGISPKEWRQVVSALADRLGVEDEQVRLERIIEANVVSQMYPNMPRGKDFEADSYVMVEECSAKGAKQLSVGGDSGTVGTCFVPLEPEDNWLPCAIRPIIILSN